MKKLVAVVLLLALPAIAQTETPRPAPKPQQVDFQTGDLIEGGLAQPLGSIYLVPPNPKFKSLIKVRMNFDDKLRESVHEM
ncbi:MAG: hypothetical protein ACOZQL_08580 [Myxococcota bacterium]